MKPEKEIRVHVSEKQLTEVIKCIHEGKSLSSALTKAGISRLLFFRSLDSVPLLSNEYARAVESRTELLVDEIIEIADTSSDPQKARNQIESRKWYASKVQPHKYGERLEVNLNANIDIRGALLDASNRIRDVISIRSTGCEPVEQIAEFKSDLDKLLE